MELGKTFNFIDGSYELRGIIDNRYIIRIRNRKENKEKYVIIPKEEIMNFKAKYQNRIDNIERNNQIYERHLAGEPLATLAHHFNVSTTRISAICAKQANKERNQ